MEKFKDHAIVIAAALLLFGLALAQLLLPDRELSLTERRPLTQFPELSFQSIADGRFTQGFEDYAVDQIPLRDALRQGKALVHRYVFRQQDDHGNYVHEGAGVTMEYPLDPASISNAAEKFCSLYDSHLADTDCKVYLSVVPDKNAFYAQSSGHLSMDYQALVAQLRAEFPQGEYIDIFPFLEAADYYYTDHHWRQEGLEDVALHLAQTMDTPLVQNYRYHIAEVPFRGANAGQLALPMKEDRICWLRSESIDGCTAYDHENGRQIPLYDETKLESKDPYDLFLSGPLSLVTVENPEATTDKELVIFRDSFGSSIAPLLAEGYRKITLVDIRYLLPSQVGRFVEFRDQDVLFLYSTQVLNHSETLK